MPFIVRLSLRAALSIVSLVVALLAGAAFAGQSDQSQITVPPNSPVADHPRRDSDARDANPLYALYNHLKDGREWCWLPHESCDNNHRIHN